MNPFLPDNHHHCRRRLGIEGRGGMYFSLRFWWFFSWRWHSMVPPKWAISGNGTESNATSGESSMASVPGEEDRRSLSDEGFCGVPLRATGARPADSVALRHQAATMASIRPIDQYAAMLPIAYSAGTRAAMKAGRRASRRRLCR